MMCVFVCVCMCVCIYIHTHVMGKYNVYIYTYEGWNFNSGNYLFTTDRKEIHVSKFYCPSV